MADPPPIRRSNAPPPPIPRLPPIQAAQPAPAAQPTASLTARTEVPVVALEEDTKDVGAANTVALVEGVLELVSAEVAGLLDSPESDDRLADLNVRAAFASWDALERPEESARLLELADSHPLAPRLRLAAALASNDLATLDRGAGPEPERRRSSRVMHPRIPMPPALAVDAAEAMLWRHGEAVRAAAIVESALGHADLPASARAAAAELAEVAHAAAGAWERAVVFARASLSPDTPPQRLAATAALVLDRSPGRSPDRSLDGAPDRGDANIVLDACLAALDRAAAVERASDTDPDAARPSDALGWLRVIDIALDAAAHLDDPRRADLLDRRAERLAGLSGGALDALATRHVAAAERARRGEHAVAATRFAALADDPANQLSRVTSRLALLQAAWSAAAANQPEVALAMHRRLADSECAEIAATHAWRAFEVAKSIGQPADDLVRVIALVASTSPSGLGASDAADATTPTTEAVARLEARGASGVRAAALVAERMGDRKRARALWRRAVAERGASTSHTARDQLARLLRGEDDDELAAVYGAWAEAERDPRAASALWCARGVVEIARGDLPAAETSLARAAELDPADPFCRAALVAMYRAHRKLDRLAPALADLGATLRSRDARAAAARERAELLVEAGDPTAARDALEHAVAERPDDEAALLALAAVHERDGHWDRGVELRLRAVNAATSTSRRAEIWLGVALAQDKLGDADAALSALERAGDSEPAPATREAIEREQIRLARAAGKIDRALAMLRTALAGEPSAPPARRVELQRELAQILTETDREPEAVVAAYLDILTHDPADADALAAIEAPARALDLWDELARAFRAAPHTPHSLDVLAEALEKTADWAELAVIRRAQLDAATNPIERARRAAELAALFTKELGDTDGAVRMLVLAQSLDFDPTRQKELLHLLREAQRWLDVAGVLERELPTIRASDLDRQVDLLLELGDLRATRLARPAEAVSAYEAVLERRPDDPVAASALEKLYEQLGRERELAAILESRAEATKDPAARAALFTRVAGMRAARGEVDAAIAAYLSAFRADPADRMTFTAMERVCYKAERWAEAMDLYATAITHVESGASRAYRLGDLYSRRAKVQLEFLADVDAAIASYQKVIEVDSQPANAAKALEDLCVQRNDWAPLIAAWEKRAETQKDPQRRADALRAANLVASEHSLGDQRQSVRLQKKLLSVDPSDAGAAAQLERYYEDASDSSGLIEILKVRLSAAITPDDTVALLKKIARTSEEGARDVETATEHYRKILEIQKDNRDALDALARIYESTEQWAEYIDVTRELIKVTTDRNTKALLFFRCGSVMEAKFGREPDAIRYYHHAIKTSQACMPAVHGLRDLYRRREEWHRVIETLELEVKLWQDDKERAGVFAQIARIYDKQLGDPDLAMQFYDSALAVDPTCLPANLAMFEVHFDRGEWERALPLALSLARPMEREGDPNTRGEFFYKLGIVSGKSGDYATAADSLRASLALRPKDAKALDELNALSRAHPDAYDFPTIYQTLEKEYRKDDDAGPLLARVLIARGAVLERDGDLDQAVVMYQGAQELAPADLQVLTALVDFYAATRGWPLAIAAIERFVGTAETSVVDRVVAMMRQAAIHADGEMDALRAIAVLTEVIRNEPSHQDAHYLLAQECFLVGRLGEARAAVDRVIELATAPGQPVSPEALARYYYYKGRILDASGDARAAAPQYRRAIDYDPGYAPPALVLARRAADGGDQRQAESLLIDAAHAAMAQGGPKAAVSLQRGLARILLASGDRTAAIEAYRGILNVEPDGASDRVALAEIYAVDDPNRGIAELRRVIERDIHHAPAYRLLAELYRMTGALDRSARVLTVLDLLGFAEDADRGSLTQLRASRSSSPLRRALEDDSRGNLMLAPAANDPIGEVFASLAQDISATIVSPSFGESLRPMAAVDARVAQMAGEIAQLYQVDAEIFVGENVPGLAATTAYPQRTIVVDRTLLGQGELPLRFLFGMSFEAIRGGYAALLQLGARQRRELVQLMRALVGAESERTAAASELIDNATPRARKIIDRLAGQREVDPGAWIDGMLACAKRAGLVACDDFGAAVFMVARLSGEELQSHDEAVALGAVMGGPDLVRYYLSDSYQKLRDVLAS